MVKHWKAFLRNHGEAIAAMAFFTVPTATFLVLHVFFVMHHRWFLLLAAPRHGTWPRSIRRRNGQWWSSTRPRTGWVRPPILGYQARHGRFSGELDGERDGGGGHHPRRRMERGRERRMPVDVYDEPGVDVRASAQEGEREATASFACLARSDRLLYGDRMKRSLSTGSS